MEKRKAKSNFKKIKRRMATFRNHRSRIKHPESQMSSLSFKNANLSDYSIFHDNLFSDEDFVLLNFQLGR